MTWLHLVSYFFGGIFMANAVPHFVSGIMGRPFQTPFAKPPGEGLSSSTVNVLWGFFNAVVGYLLVVRVGSFDLRSMNDVLALAVGALVISFLMARHFGQFHGGNTPGTFMKNLAAGPFRALSIFNFRVWSAGALVSNIGTWMQRVAQDWLVLTQLTHHDASAVGFVMALQFAPQLLLLPWTGFAADHLNQRKLLMVTQATMGVLALALGILTITGNIRLWQVYVFAFLFGSAAALDAPVRQTFVAELVGDEHLHNAVALNSTSFNARPYGRSCSRWARHREGRNWLGVCDQRPVIRRRPDLDVDVPHI
jgi:Transmembrane secretion effector